MLHSEWYHIDVWSKNPWPSITPGMLVTHKLQLTKGQDVIGMALSSEIRKRCSSTAFCDVKIVHKSAGMQRHGGIHNETPANACAGRQRSVDKDPN